jgi:hypothetical protein
MEPSGLRIDTCGGVDGSEKVSTKILPLRRMRSCQPSFFGDAHRLVGVAAVQRSAQ